MAHVQPANVPVAGPANVVGAYVMRLKNADGCGTHKESVFIEMAAGVILVVVVTELCGVAFEKRVLPVKIRQKHLLMAAAESVQAAVRVFFQKEKICSVILQPVRPQVAKHPHSRLFLREQQATEVAAELLDAAPDGKKIIIRAKVMDLLFDKGFL